MSNALGRCWGCGTEVPASGGRRLSFCAECARCPRCGGSTVIWDTRAKPFWVRCIGCLHGWWIAGQPFVDRPRRSDTEIDLFTTHILFKENGFRDPPGD